MAESRSGNNTPEVNPSPSATPRKSVSGSVTMQGDTDLAKEEIICLLCIDIFDTPRSLQCQHPYCEKCLMGLQRASFTNETSIKCPACNAQTTIPEEGIQGFPLNMKLQQFIESLSPEQKVNIAQSVKVDSKTTGQKPLENKCMKHTGMQLEYFCEDCTALVCGKCMLNEHRLHKDVKYASDALSEHISSLGGLLVPLNSLLPKAQGIMESLQSNVAKIRHSGDKAASIVKTYFSGIQQILTEREMEILEAVKSEVTAKESTLSKQQESIKETIDDLQKCVAGVQNVSKSRRNDISFLLDEQRLKVKVGTHMVRLESCLKTSDQGVSVTFQKPFEFNSTFENLCKYLGEVEGKENPPLMDSTHPASKDNLEKNGMETQLPVADTGPNSRQPLRRYKSADYQSPLVKNQMKKSCTNVEFSKQTPSLDSSFVRPRSHLDSFQKEALILSPFLEIGAKDLLGTSQRIGPMYPYGVCFGKPDCLIVTDCRNHTFSILTPTGKCLDSIAMKKKREGEYVDPRAVTTDDDGNILIVDGGTTNMIRKYSPAGKCISKFKARTLTSGNCIGEPTGIAVLDNGNILVTDAEKSCIHCFDAAGKYQGKLDTTESHRPKNPADITYDKKKRIIVIDRGGHCVFMYSVGGQYLNTFGGRGYNPGDLLYPSGVTTDSEGNIFVAESGNHRISVFSAQGKFLTTFGEKGSEPGMFSHPRHMCMNPQGRLVVADECNQRIQIFNVKELLQQLL